MKSQVFQAGVHLFNHVGVPAQKQTSQWSRMASINHAEQYTCSMQKVSHPRQQSIPVQALPRRRTP